MVDIHCHILPGIDDGAPDMGESLAMARAAVSAGIVTIAATPHLRAGFPLVHVEELADRCAELNTALSAEQIPLSVVAGAEVAVEWALDASDEELRLASYGQRGTDLLIEASAATWYMLPTLLPEIAQRGYRITLAHPERTSRGRRDSGLLHELAQSGVIMEVNAESLRGRGFRSQLADLAHHICKHYPAVLIASDSHRAHGARGIEHHGLTRERVGQLVGPKRAEWLLASVPAAVLDGVAVPDGPPSAPARRSVFGRRPPL